MEASTRVSAVGRAYSRLASNTDYENIDLVAYLREVVEDLGPAVVPCEIQLDTPKEIQFADPCRIDCQRVNLECWQTRLSRCVRRDDPPATRSERRQSSLDFGQR